jgi:hypothetical protein
MSWTKLDDGLIDHPKVSTAAAKIGPNGPTLAIGFFAILIMWSNKHLTDGFIPRDVLTTLPHAQEPLAIADALVRAGLLERAKKGSPPTLGFLIHDFGDYNFSAAAIKAKRRADRERKRGNGHG